MHMIEDCALKIERASRHLVELREMLRAHEASHPPITTTKHSLDGSLTHLDMTTFAYPRAVSGPLGDVIHNLRATLDILAVALVERSSDNAKGVFFPIASSKIAFGKQLKNSHLSRAGAAAVEAVKALQPYKGGNDDLWGLHDLDIRDKHHAIIPVDSREITPAIEPYDINFDTGTAKVRVVPGSEGKAFAVFPLGGPFASEEVVSTLERLVALVTSVAQEFDRRSL